MSQPRKELNSRKTMPKVTQSANNDYEAEPASAFPPIRRSAKKEEDDGDIEPEHNNTILNMKRSKFPYSEHYNNFKVASPLISAEQAYLMTIKKNIPRFADALDWLCQRIIKKTNSGFYIRIKLHEIENLKDHSHEEYETFINVAAFNGYKFTRTMVHGEAPGAKFTPETQVTISWIPKDS